MLQKTDAHDTELFINHNLNVIKFPLTSSVYCSELGGTYEAETSGCRGGDQRTKVQKERVS